MVTFALGWKKVVTKNWAWGGGISCGVPQEQNSEPRSLSEPCGKRGVDCRGPWPILGCLSLYQNLLGWDSDSLSHALRTAVLSLGLVCPLCVWFLQASVAFSSLLSSFLSHTYLPWSHVSLSTPLSPSSVFSLSLCISRCHHRGQDRAEAPWRARFGHLDKAGDPSRLCGPGYVSHLSVIQPGPDRGAQCPNSGQPATSNLD